MVETDKGARIAAVGKKSDLSARQLAEMRAGEAAAMGGDVHAEIKALNAAMAAGVNPAILVAARKFCPACAAGIKAAGGTQTSKNTAVFKKEQKPK